MGFDIWRRVSRLRYHHDIIDSRPWSGPGHRLCWSFNNPSPTIFGTVAAIWLVVTQWLSSAFGGYLTGRLRTKWVGIRTEEVLFRDTAHGLLAWALASLLMAALVTLGSAATAGLAAASAASAPNAAPVTADAAERARKVAVAFSFTTSLSLPIGAASAAGALGRLSSRRNVKAGKRDGAR
jgi:hypothetical protein